MLEALGELPSEGEETTVASPPVSEENPSLEKPLKDGGEVVANFRDFYSCYLQ